MNLTHVPLRATTGLFILNSGLSKLNATPETAQGIHGLAATAYPAVKELEPGQFTKLLGAGEVALGSALLLPKVPSAVAGTALTGFGVSLLGLYFRVPGMREPGSLQPTQQGLPIAKDTWLVGAGATLAAQGFFGGVRRASRKTVKSVSAAADQAKEVLPFTS